MRGFLVLMQLALLWVEPVLVVTLVVSLVVALVRRRRFRRLWWALGACIVMIGLFLDYQQSDGFLLDGPLLGQACDQVPVRQPDQVFQVASGRLEVFDPSTGEVAPIVLYRRLGHEPTWCVRATGAGDSTVRSIRFARSETWLLGLGRIVIGSVDRRSTRWVLWPTGGLKGYWNNW